MKIVTIAENVKQASAKKKNASKAVIFLLLLPLLFMASMLVSKEDLQQAGLQMKERDGQLKSSPSNDTSTHSRQDYVYPDVLYGHVHMAKTGGTSLNGLLANRFTRVCGHKGYSYDAFAANTLALARKEAGERIVAGNNPRDRVMPETMESIGYHDCDYISSETPHSFWITNFGGAKFHNISMELHVPCRDPLDHLMSYCNMFHKELLCDHESGVSGTYESVDNCMAYETRHVRFHSELEEHFDVKCYDFRKQFTTYIDVMAEKLQQRRIVSQQYVQRETNRPRNKTAECIWGREDLQAKVRAYLLKNWAYYGFCEKCMGSKNELTNK